MEGEFLALVDEHVADNPVATTALTPAAVRFAAGRLLLHQAGRRADTQSQSASTKFAATLFVLIIEEVIHAKRSTILGFDVESVYAVLADHAQALDPRAFHDAVCVLDSIGRASATSEQPGCIDALLNADARSASGGSSLHKLVTLHEEGARDAGDSRARAVKHTVLSALGTCIPETAGLSMPSGQSSTSHVASDSASSDPFGRSILNKLGEKLTLRAYSLFGIVAAVLVVYIASTPLMLPGGSATQTSGIEPVIPPRPADGSSSSGVGGVEVAYVSSNLAILSLSFLCTGFFAMMFPANLDSRSARICTNSIMLIGIIGELHAVHVHLVLYAETRGSLFAAANASDADTGNGDWRPRARLLVHYLVLAEVILFNNLYAGVAHFAYGATWRRFRLCMLADGAFFLACIVLLRALGEERYPPGDVPFAAAFARPVTPIVVAAAFTPAFRQRLANWGASCGLNHVTFSLGELKPGEFRSIVKVHGWSPSASGWEDTSSEGQHDSRPKGKIH